MVLGQFSDICGPYIRKLAKNHKSYGSAASESVVLLLFLGCNTQYDICVYTTRHNSADSVPPSKRAAYSPDVCRLVSVPKIFHIVLGIMARFPYRTEGFIDRGMISSTTQKEFIDRGMISSTTQKEFIDRGMISSTTQGVRVVVLNTTFNNISFISWRSVLLMKETVVPGENHRPG